MKALIELVERQRWSNSLEDLATSIAAVKDDQPRLGRNTDLLLKTILDRLANSGEWKLMEMCHRHELKYVVNNRLSCSHQWNHYTDRRNPETDTMEWTIPIRCTHKMTRADVQDQIHGFNNEQTEVECKVCHKIVQLEVFFTVPHGCDPDFLTLVCDKPISLDHQDVTFQFGNSLYNIKSVTHWDKERRMAAVSREKNDGSWWWHGVAKPQAVEHKYSQAQLESRLHFKDVQVLFGVRIEPGEVDVTEHEDNVREDISKGGRQMSHGENQLLEGELEGATAEDLNCDAESEDVVITEVTPIRMDSCVDEAELRGKRLEEGESSDDGVVIEEIPRGGRDGQNKILLDAAKVSERAIEGVENVVFSEEQHQAPPSSKSKQTIQWTGDRIVQLTDDLLYKFQQQRSREDMGGVGQKDGPPARQLQQQQGEEQDDRQGAPADHNLLYDVDKAMQESRKTGEALTPEAMVTRSLQFLDRLKVRCERPPLPYIKQDGDCLWACFAKAANPLLKDEHLRAERFYLRMRAVGKAIEAIRSMDDEGFASIQSVMALGEGQIPPGREDVLRQVARYMESGEWSGLAGDLVPYIASVFLGQPLLIIDVSGKKAFCTYADLPVFAAFAGEPEMQYPCIVSRNINHFELISLPEESREAATHLYQRLRTSGNIALFDTPAPRTAADDEGSGRDVEQRQERPDERGSAGEQIAVMIAINLVANNFGFSLSYFQVIMPSTRAVGRCRKLQPGACWNRTTFFLILH